MATIKEISVEDKLRALYALQLVDSKIDEIRNVRGELPLEVDDLEDEVAGLSTRLEKLKSDLETIDEQIKEKKNAIEAHNAAIKKYLEQQKNVRNNREFNSLTKEVEFQELEIQLHEKKTKEALFRVDQKKESLAETKERLDIRSQDLEIKKKELEAIIAETQKDEEKLRKDSDKAKTSIDEPLLIAYDRLRINSKNGLAVVPIDRDACGGCFNRIPPQRQLDIMQRKKIIVCEHCGRILVTAEETAE